MKKLFITMLILVGVTGMAYAVQQSTSTVVKVTCAPGLSVSIDIPSYTFSSVDPATPEIATDSATVTNDSLGRTEDYTIDCDTYTTPSTGSVNWNIDADGTPGEDYFSLQVLLKATPPTAGEFAANDFLDDVTSTQNMDDPAFCVDAGSYDGDNIAKDTQRVLWFRIHPPSNTTTQNEQQVTVTITAEDAGTF